MKRNILYLVVFMLFSTVAVAQTKEKDDKSKKDSKGKTEIILNTRGLTVKKLADSLAADEEKKDSKWGGSLQIDLGFNQIKDETNYADPKVLDYLKVPANKQNSNLFDLNFAKSVNFNLYWLKSYRLLKTPGQRIYINSGLGMQIYNFRYDNNITYTKTPSAVILDTISFSKNKLGINYLSVPLSFTFKTRIWNNASNHKKDRWLVYGFGASGGYVLSSWTKQKSKEFGKVKQRGQFEFERVNACATAEFGIEGVFRLYGSYQVTSIFDNGIQQYPICIGLRFGGI